MCSAGWLERTSPSNGGGQAELLRLLSKAVVPDAPLLYPPARGRARAIRFTSRENEPRALRKEDRPHAAAPASS